MHINWEDIKIYKYLQDKNSEFIENIDSMIDYSQNVLKYICITFDNYTGHDIEHSKMVIKYMSDIITDIEKLSDLELTVIIYSGLLHDIGMFVTAGEIELIKNNKYDLTDFKYNNVFEKYKNEKISIQEIVRPIHAKKSKKYILDMVEADATFKKLFCIPKMSNIHFYEEVANICMAHNEEFEWLKFNLKSDLIKGKYKLNSQFISILLRIGDLLDIDEHRTPLYLYNLLSPKGVSKLEWKQHFVIENTEKIIFDTNSDMKKILLCGVSNEVIIHRKILKYIDYINFELKNSLETSEKYSAEYFIKLKPLVDNKIITNNFSFSDFKLTLDYTSVTNLLMGENIYGHKKYGLRELVQNSIDACKLMSEEYKSNEEFKRDIYSPYIRIEIDKNRNRLCIVDNGIGMSLDIIKKYFLNVGVSYYLSDEFKFKGYNYKAIGNYGIGFLACFMLSDNVGIVTKRFNENKTNEVLIEKDSEYICLTEKDDYRRHGTEVVLDYIQFKTVFKDIENIKAFIEKTFLYNDIPITILEYDGDSTIEEKCCLFKLKEEEKNIARIDGYLNDIFSYIDIKYRDMKFIDKLSQIEAEEFICTETYIYSEGDLIKEESLQEVLISDFIENDTIVYLSIPIINDEKYEKFMKAYDILEDYEEALEKIEPYAGINIFLRESDIPENISIRIKKFDEEESLIIDNDIELLKGFNKSNFCKEFCDNNDVPLIIKIRRQKVVSGKSSKCLCIGENYSLNMYNNNLVVFNKGIRLHSIRGYIPYICNGIIIKEVVVNCKNKYIVPNVARNDISTEICNDLFYAIGKAIMKWLRDNLELGSEEMALLDLFLEKYYYKDNEFLVIK